MICFYVFNCDQLLVSVCGELFGIVVGCLFNDLMLMFDCIIDIYEDGGLYGKGMVCVELDICLDLWFFGCYFIGDLVMFGCFGLDVMWQLIGFFLIWLGVFGKGCVLGCGEVKFIGQVLLDVKFVCYEIDISWVINCKLVMVQLDVCMYVDDCEIYSVCDLCVGLFIEIGSF